MMQLGEYVRSAAYILADLEGATSEEKRAANLIINGGGSGDRPVTDDQLRAAELVVRSDEAGEQERIDAGRLLFTAGNTVEQKAAGAFVIMSQGQLTEPERLAAARFLFGLR